MADPTVTRDGIERLRYLAGRLDAEARAKYTEFGAAEDLFRELSHVGPGWSALVAHALNEPDRIAAAERRSAEAMREACAQKLGAAATELDTHPGPQPYVVAALRALEAGTRSLPLPAAPVAEPGPESPWEETARHYAAGQEYYQGLLDRIGQRLGSTAYAADDGSISEDVLRAKVPELVEARIAALEAENAKLREGIKAVADLMDESGGVYGLHLNGDPSPWDELRTGGRFECWLVHFDDARALLQEDRHDRH